MSKLHITTVLFLGLFAISLTPLFAQQNNPVIEEAKKLAASLEDDPFFSDSPRIIANTAIENALRRLGLHDQAGELTQESLEMAKQIKDEYKRARALAKIVKGIPPESINSYDEILKENVGGIYAFEVLDAILQQCCDAKQYDLGFQLFEKVYERQNSETKKNMRFYINRIYPYQIFTGQVDEAIASANRLKDPELRRFVLGEIKKDARAHRRLAGQDQTAWIFVQSHSILLTGYGFLLLLVTVFLWLAKKRRFALALLVVHILAAIVLSATLCLAKEPATLGDRILQLQSAGRYKEMFELVDELAEKVAEYKAAGRSRHYDDIEDDKRGGRGASLVETYSHPVVKLRRERGDLAGAVDLAQKLFARHVPEVEILSIARGYANAGDYASALEVGGSAGGVYCSDSGIRGYVAYAMFQHGKKEEADQLLTETLRKIDSGDMSLHRDFIVGLMLCGKIDDAIRLSTTLPVVDRSEHEEPTDQYVKQPTIILKCLLMMGREAEAVQLIDEWKHAAGKAWGIWILTQWDFEEHGNVSLLTPELKQRWIDFLVNYADTLEEPNVTTRMGEWYRAAECLIDLGDKESALKVLDKALVDIHDFEPMPPDHRRYGSVQVRVQTGRLLIRLGEREKADIAFVAAIQDTSLYISESLYLQNHGKAESLKYILFDYTQALQDKPEDIRTWPGYQPSENYRPPMTLRYLWEHRLFSTYMIM